VVILQRFFCEQPIKELTPHNTLILKIICTPIPQIATQNEVI
jgi:hypothetical protein